MRERIEVYKTSEYFDGKLIKTDYIFEWIDYKLDVDVKRESASLKGLAKIIIRNDLPGVKIGLAYMDIANRQGQIVEYTDEGSNVELSQGLNSDEFLELSIEMSRELEVMIEENRAEAESSHNSH